MLGAAPARDLEVAIPPGSPLDWAGSFPGYTPPRRAQRPRTGEDPGESGTRGAAVRGADTRFASSFALVRVLTWDIAAHLQWIALPAAERPVTGDRSARARPPNSGDPLYWVTLAPLLRLMLHPELVSLPETLAHLVEIGEPTLLVLDAARSEKNLAGPCSRLRSLIRSDHSAPSAPGFEGTPREKMFARFALEEILSEPPHDPGGTFGKRLFLFSDDVEAPLVRFTSHSSLELQRAAVAALARFETADAWRALAERAAHSPDPVVVVRALAGLARAGAPVGAGPLVERLGKARDDVERVALIGALGRLGASDALQPLLELGERALKRQDTDLLISILSALTRIPATGMPWKDAQDAEVLPRDAVREFATHVSERARALGTELRTEMRPTQPPDNPDQPTARAEILEQLALLVRVAVGPVNEALDRSLLELAEDGPLDPRLSERPGMDPLFGVYPNVRVLYIEALERRIDVATKKLEELVREPGLDASLRGLALRSLPRERRNRLARALLTDEIEGYDLRITALDLLAADPDADVALACRELLERCVELPPGGGGGAERFLYTRALRAASERGQLHAADLMPLLHHVKSSRIAIGDALIQIESMVEELLQAAAGRAQKVEIAKRLDALLALVAEHRLNPQLDPTARADLREFLLALLANAPDQRGDPKSMERLQNKIMEQLLGSPAPEKNPNRAEFAPSVPLEEEILAALARTREPAAAELLVQLLQNRRSGFRGWTCLALASCAETFPPPARLGTAREMLPFLLDEDPFVRLCASESLRLLTERVPAIDWMYADTETRFAAAQETERVLSEAGR